jgi:aldose 1-epimerase
MTKFLGHGLGLLLTATLTLSGCEEPKNTTNQTTAKKSEKAGDSDTKTSGATASAASSAEEHPTTTTQPANDENKMSITKAAYGKMPDGAEINQYTLSNSHGMKVKLINYGAIITAVDVPDRDGKVENVTLYRDNLADYMEVKNGKATTPYFGATIGRYGNRIAKGRFTLDGKEYKLAVNNGPNALHGGLKGFDKVVWKAEEVRETHVVTTSPPTLVDVAGIAFSYTSHDGEEGYPGTLKVKVTYSLSDDNELRMDYEATTDKDTVLNLTNHTYWNLSGAGNGDILKEVMMINADRMLPVDNTLIPTGKLEPVKGTPYDFTKPKPIGKDMPPFVLEKNEGGYDHCYILNRKDNGLDLAAEAYDPASGRVMVVTTTQPAVQFYVGNYLDGSVSGGGKPYKKHYAFCLETQHYPDSPNHPDFPTTELKPGETYKQTTVYKFSTQK